MSGGGIQFFIYEDTPLGRTIIEEYEVSPADVEKTIEWLNSTVKDRCKENPDKTYGWYEHVIDDLPPGAPFQ